MLRKRLYQPESAPIKAPNPSDWMRSITARFSTSPKVALRGVPVLPVPPAAPGAVEPAADAEAEAEAAGVADAAAGAEAEALATRADWLGATLATAPDAAGDGEAKSSPVVLENVPEFNVTTTTSDIVAINAAIAPASHVARGAKKPAIIGGRSGTG